MNGTISYLGDKTYYNARFCQISFHVPHFFGLLGKELVNDAVTNRATGGNVEARHADDALASGRERR